MTPQEIQNQSLEIQKELKEAKKDLKDSKKPIYLLLGLVFILLIVLMIIPQYAIKIDPKPDKIPSIEEIYSNYNIEKHNYNISNYEQYRYLYNPEDIKISADQIASYSCDNNKICQTKAIFYFVKDNFHYISDPNYQEYVKSAEESLITKGGDCDDASVLLANLLGAIGVKPRLVFIPGHVYVQIYLPEANNKYKEDGWINLDATCESCNYGEIPSKNKDKPKILIEL